MTNRANNASSGTVIARAKPDYEEILTQLEKFPVEVLEAALLVSEARKQNQPR